jgi:hypothetical protein
LLDITNIELYLAKVQQFFFHDTISSLLLNFKNGFNNLIHITKLNTFYVSEIEKLYSGDNSNAPWNYEDLKSHIIPSYGYHEKRYFIIINIEIINIIIIIIIIIVFLIFISINIITNINIVLLII